MNTRVVSPTVDGPINPTSAPRPNKYALITIDACVPILGQVLRNVQELFERCTKPLSTDSYLDLCSKVGSAANILLPNPPMSPRNQHHRAKLISDDFMWENALSATLHHMRPKLADGLPHAMNELTSRNITPILLTHRSAKLFSIVFDSLSSQDQNTIKGLFPPQHRLAASSITKNARLHSHTPIYGHLGLTQFATDSHKPFAIEVTPHGTLCATSHGIETIAYDLIRGRTRVTPYTRALTASGACAVIQRWGELKYALDKTIRYPIRWAQSPSVH